MNDYHEPTTEMSASDRDCVRALLSLKEEIEAVDWYHQRAAVTKNESLKKILEHNRDEEMEHACMTLEWLRRNMPGWDEQLKTYIFSEGDVTELEDKESGSKEKEQSDLGIGGRK